MSRGQQPPRRRSNPRRRQPPRREPPPQPTTGIFAGIWGWIKKYRNRTAMEKYESKLWWESHRYLIWIGAFGAFMAFGIIGCIISVISDNQKIEHFTENRTEILSEAQADLEAKRYDKVIATAEEYAVTDDPELQRLGDEAKRLKTQQQVETLRREIAQTNDLSSKRIKLKELLALAPNDSEATKQLGEIENDLAESSPRQHLPSPTSKPAPKITGSLSDFKIDSEFGQFVFTLKLSNLEPEEKTVYAVVYGKNDAFTPPRRGAWPLGGLLFRFNGSDRGRLSSSDISNDWQSRPDNIKGMKRVLQPNGSDLIEGALPINQTSPHAAWRGQRLSPLSMYNEVYLWVYSEDGTLIFEQNYNLK